MSACSAAKSGQGLHPSRVHAWHSLRLTSWYEPSFIQIWKTPLMFIFFMSCFLRPYLASNSSSKMASSNVFEHSRPMLRAKRRATLPALRTAMAGGDDDMQLIPTSASFSAPPAIASAYAMVLAEYVYREPADFSTSSLLRATPGMAFHVLPSPSRNEVR